MKEVKLGDIVTYNKGYAFKSKEYKNEGIMVVRVTDFTTDSISNKEAVYISEQDFFNKYLLKTGDILIQTVGSWENNPNSIVGKVVRVPEECNNSYLNQNIVRILPKNRINNEYLYYALKANKFSNYCVVRGQGAANQASITLDTIFRFKFKVHEEDIQQKIVDILSKYDNLINNNNKRISILGQMTEDIYINIFAYRKIKNNSKEIKIGEILNFQRGISYSSEEIECEDGNNLINLKNINAYGGFRRDGTKKYNGKYKKEQIVNTGDLIMGVTDMTQDRRTVGAVALIPTMVGISVISADLVKINSKLDNIFLYSMFKYGNLSKYISQFANGANVLHLKPQSINNIKIQLPDNDLIDKYVTTTKPIIEEIDKLNIQNDNLKTQRDLLLPRLMSGKLEIK